MENDIQSILKGLRHIATQIDKMQIGEWESQSKEVSALHGALCAAQMEMDVMGVDSKGYTGTFASLPGIFRHIKKPLGGNGLSITQEITELNGKPYVITTLRHESGEWVRAKSPIFFPDKGTGKDFNQECGKAITYMRRYSLEALLGLKGDNSDYDAA